MEEQRKKPWLVLENQTFEPKHITRISLDETQDLESEEGIKYIMIIHLSVSPYKLIFGYATYELRAKKISWVEKQLELCGFVFLKRGA